MKSGLTITPASLSQFERSLKGVTQQVQMAAEAGMSEAAQKFYSYSQMKVPRVTGALASSGRVVRHDGTTQLSRVISYGDSTVNPRTGKTTASYAIRVHEVYNPEHPNSYKWLENSLTTFGQQEFMASLADAFRAAF